MPVVVYSKVRSRSILGFSDSSGEIVDRIRIFFRGAEYGEAVQTSRAVCLSVTLLNGEALLTTSPLGR